MKLGKQTILEMLDDVEAVTKARFYADPEPIASPVELFRVPEGSPGGEPFAAMSGREKWQVLGDYTKWQDYEERGISMKQLDRVFRNVIEGKPREKWLEGTGLARPERKSVLGYKLEEPQKQPDQQQDKSRGR